MEAPSSDLHPAFAGSSSNNSNSHPQHNASIPIQSSNSPTASTQPTASSSPSISRAASIQRSDRGNPSTSVSASASIGSTRLSRAPSTSSGAPGSISRRSQAGTSTSASTRNRSSNKPNKPKDRHVAALNSIRNFLKGRSSYDVLPVSFRVIVLDTKLVVKPALDVMWQAGVVSAPLWHSTPTPPTTDSKEPSEAAPQETEAKDTTEKTESTTNNAIDSSSSSEQKAVEAYQVTSAEQVEGSKDPTSSEAATSSSKSVDSSTPTNSSNATVPLSASNVAAASAEAASKAIAPPPRRPGFAGMLTVNDIIHLIQHYYQHSSYDTAALDVETFRLERLTEIEQDLKVPQPPLLSIHPLRPLFEACQLLIKTHARRLPLLDFDEQTGMETVVSVLTQYRVLKFIAMNCRETAGLHRSIRSIGIGTYIASAQGPGYATHRGSTSTSASRTSSAPVLDELNLAHQSAAEDPSTAAPVAVTPSLEPVIEPVATPTSEQPHPVAISQALSENEAHPITSATLPQLEEEVLTSSAQTNPESISNQHAPLATATLDTTVFDVVHLFSERGISAVPILDEDGFVVDLYETVDVITLVRSGAYQSLDLTIRQALLRRPADFPGVFTCSPEDSLANIFALLRRRRAHRLLILEPEPEFQSQFAGGSGGSARNIDEELEAGPPRRRGKGKLIGILCLSDILNHVIGGEDSALRSTRERHPSSSSGNNKSNSTVGTTTNASTSNATSPPTSTSASAAGDLNPILSSVNNEELTVNHLQATANDPQEHR